MHPTVLDIALTLRAARRARGLSQRQLAERLGLTQAQISRFEHGRAELRLSSLVELARGTGLELMLVSRSSVPAVQALGLATTDTTPVSGDPPGG